MAQKSRKRSTGRTVFLLLRILFRLVLYLAVIVILAVAARTAFSFGYSVFADEAMEPEPGTDVVVTITKDMTDSEVGDLMENKGLVKSRLIFLLRAAVYDYQIYPGTYVLNTSQTLSEMIEQMSLSSEGEGEEEGE